MKEVAFDRRVYFVLTGEFNNPLIVSEEEVKLEFEDCDCNRNMQDSLNKEEET